MSLRLKAACEGADGSRTARSTKEFKREGANGKGLGGGDARARASAHETERSVEGLKNGRNGGGRNCGNDNEADGVPRVRASVRSQSLRRKKCTKVKVLVGQKSLLERRSRCAKCSLRIIEENRGCGLQRTKPLTTPSVSVDGGGRVIVMGVARVIVLVLNTTADCDPRLCSLCRSLAAYGTDQEFLCAINGHMMKQPARSPHGHVFEYSTILLWLESRGRVCPFTGKPLSRGANARWWRVRVETIMLTRTHSHYCCCTCKQHMPSMHAMKTLVLALCR